MRKTAAVVLAGLVLSLTAGCGTADPLNNGDPVPTRSATPDVGDSHWYPNVGATPKVSASAKAKHKTKHHKVRG
jgi:hypothetical protein